MTDLRHRRLPARTPGVLSRALGDEYVVIHPATQTAHALTGLTARVWRACESDGVAPDVSDAELGAAVAHLVSLELLVASGTTRRAMLQRGGLVLAGAGVATIVLPEASAAASTVVGPTTVMGSSSIVIPAGSRNIVLVFSGGGGGYAQDRSGTPGTAGSITLSPGVTLTSDLTVSYAIGTMGSAGTSAGNTNLTNPGGTGAYAGGDPGGSNQSQYPNLGGGGGAASRIILTGGLTGTLIAGGGGGAGNGYSSSGTAPLPMNGGAGGSVQGSGAGGAGAAGATGSAPGAGGAAVAAGGTGAAGENGATQVVDVLGVGLIPVPSGTNGGGGGGGGATAGRAGGNGDTTSAGGGGGAGSSSIGTVVGQIGVAQATYGTTTTSTNGSFTYSYIKP